LDLSLAEAAPTQRPTYLGLDKGTKTAAATAGAATLSKTAGKVTSEALTTAAAAAYTLTITNTKVAAADQCFASVAYGTSTTGVPAVTRVTPGAKLAGGCRAQHRRRSGLERHDCGFVLLPEELRPRR
jgi:hypothetical protein